MDKSKLLFHREYDSFYNMVENNEIFSKYCEDVFGIDFSQDGYSDLEQIKDLLKAADIKSEYKVLDIGCGNGKMAEFIADQTGAIVYGFDYSENAINNAIARTQMKSNLIFEEGVFGEKQYSPESFDVILSIDTMYYTLDMETFVKQIYGWLKPNGLFITFYEEGHLQGISVDEYNTELAIVFKKNRISYEVMKYTKQLFELMKHKREVLTRMKELFIENKMEFYYHCAMDTSVDVSMTYEDFQKGFNRFMYIVKKAEKVNKELSKIKDKEIKEYEVINEDQDVKEDNEDNEDNEDKEHKEVKEDLEVKGDKEDKEDLEVIEYIENK
ncbi:MAG: class I SAM-dependent methyltransferase, partial [Herbinix sp.]|nr:class I SAM-dependent methyltransferase [Herbinix sp.]